MNPVTKIGIALILTLSFLCFVEALKCFQCTFSNTNGPCLHQEPPCKTQKNKLCVWQVKFSGGKFLYGVQKCSDICTSRALILGNSTNKIRCCKDKSLCNKS
ncbi:secreted seminal-vesicle Ly-6 protein 1-like [Grammomys surdaster]|uniref:secreted seminal-vesicle Ly-6 protein 1-like n=1 Tax=Grammomys surdaster TaxID=491861 RepID=UPI0010A0B40A|nr:secreted seminal-vesicle Ly-6 protein 1-like [Grammomys surdaster]